MLIKHNRIARRWLGPAVLSPRSLWAQGESGCLYDFSQAAGNLDGSDVLVVPGASLKTAQDKRSGVANPGGLTSTQATVAARGKWGRPPVGGVRNLLLESRLLAAAAWLRQAGGTGVAASVTDNSEIDPEGLLTASRVVLDKGAGTTATDYSIWRQGVPVVAGTMYAFSLWLRTTDGTTRSVLFQDNSGAGIGSQLLSVTPTWRRFVISGVAASTMSALLQLMLRGSYGTSDQASLAVWRPQSEVGSAATTAQVVTAGGLDVSEDGLLRAGFWRPDFADDVLPWTLPAAVAGELFVIGRNGSWIESRAAAAGTAVAIGPTGNGLTPGILRAVGDVIAAGFVGRSLSPAERLRIVRAYRGAGAKGQLQAGAELVINGGFASGTGWTNTSTGTGAMAISGGQMTLTGVDASNRGKANAAQISGAVIGRAYLVTWDVVSGTANSQVTAASGGTVLDVFGATSPGPKQAVFIAGATTIDFSVNVYGAGAVVFDNISIKPLTPEALA
jgi:hypothetical protein